MSARAALTGCLALLQRKGARVAGVPAANSPTAVVMMQRFLQHIMVQAFGQPERMLAFELLETAIEVHDTLSSVRKHAVHKQHTYQWSSRQIGYREWHYKRLAKSCAHRAFLTVNMAVLDHAS